MLSSTLRFLEEEASLGAAGAACVVGQAGAAVGVALSEVVAIWRREERVIGEAIVRRPWGWLVSIRRWM